MLAVTLLPSDIAPFFSMDATQNLLDTVVTAVLRTFYAESQDLAKRNLFG